MKDSEKKELLNRKIKLLEDFIWESNRLADLYGWHAPDFELTELDRLSDELDDITEKIKKEIK